MKYYVIAYSNSKGKVYILTLNSEKDLNDWIEKLDRRIKRGTCGGYDVLVLGRS